MKGSATRPALTFAGRPKALAFIVVTVVLHTIAYGIVQPQMPALLREVSTGDIATVSQVFGYMMSGFAIMQFLASPFMGGLSDRYGRRPLIVV